MQLHMAKSSTILSSCLNITTSYLYSIWFEINECRSPNKTYYFIITIGLRMLHVVKFEISNNHL